MPKKLSERTFHLMLVAFLLGLFLGLSASFRLSANEPAHRYLDYFHQVYNHILTEYVDTPVTKDLFFGAINGMMKGLNDPYSRFMDEKAFKEFREDITGDFIGVGIEITVKDGEIVVISPIE
nr:S41 family peptidase [Spirochaetota bacterium]